VIRLRHDYSETSPKRFARRRARYRVAAATLIAVAALTIFALRASDSMADFEVYWRGAARAAAAEPLYRADDEHYRFKYFPAFAVLTIPMGLLPLPAAKAVWFTASALLLALLVGLSLEVVPERRRANAVLAVAAIAVLGKFYGHELILGQVNVLFAVLAVGALLAMQRGRERLAGALLALTIAIKPYGVLFIPWLLLRRKAPSVTAALLTLAVITVLPVPLYGVGGTVALYRDWWTTVSGTTPSNLLNPDNVSFASAYAKWFGAGTVATSLAMITALAAVAGTAVVVLYRRGLIFPEAIEGSGLLLLVPLLSPQGWDYVLLLATPAVILLANYLDRLPLMLRTAAVVAGLTMGLSVFDVMGRSSYARFMEAAVVTVCASVLLVSLYMLRARRVA
jgi:uncharacterized membrane protein